MRELLEQAIALLMCLDTEEDAQGNSCITEPCANCKVKNILLKALDKQ